MCPGRGALICSGRKHTHTPVSRAEVCAHANMTMRCTPARTLTMHAGVQLECKLCIVHTQRYSYTYSMDVYIDPPTILCINILQGTMSYNSCLFLSHSFPPSAALPSFTSSPPLIGCQRHVCGSVGSSHVNRHVLPPADCQNPSICHFPESVSVLWLARC